MAHASRPLIRLSSEALPDDELTITKLTGTECISRLYSFELELASPRFDFNIDAVLKKKARIEIEQGSRTADGGLMTGLPLLIHGRISSFEQVERNRKLVRYRAKLEPHLWSLSLGYQSRIFLNKTVPDIVKEVLESAGFDSEAYEFRNLSGNHLKREYVVQYEESDLDFISRWLEHEGIFFYFEQGESSEKVVFLDSVGGCAAIRSNPEVLFLEVVEEQERDWFAEETVRMFGCRQETVPKKVVLKDYNWRKPELDLRCSANVQPDGEGVVYEYNNHYRTKEEGQQFATIRAQEILCRKKVFRGNGYCRSFRAGQTWSLQNHFQEGFNRAYLISEVRHSATQKVEFVSSKVRVEGNYSNEFVCMVTDKPYRPERLTPWPAIRGSMHARVDASGDGEYAEIDGDGRYKVKLPLDLSGRSNGKASRFVRMAQPYAGSDHGMHFPLHKGSEVLITHIDGDPDRPIITGAVPNKETGNVIASGNETCAGIKTAGGNQISMEDQDGHQRIFLRAGSGNSGIVIGSGSDDRVEMKSVKMAQDSVIQTNFALTFNDTIGALGASITSGYPLLQAGLLAIRLGTSFLGEDLLAAKAKKDNWPSLWTTAVPLIVASAGSFISSRLASAFITDKIIEIAKVQALEFTYDMNNPRWWEIHKKAWNGLRSFVTGTGTGGYGGYLIRGSGGTRLQLNRKGENILVATDVGKLVLWGNNASLCAKEEVFIGGEKSINLLNEKSSLVLQPDGTALNHHDQTLTMTENMIELRSPKRVVLGAQGTEIKGELGKETYLDITGDASMLSGKDGVSLYAAESSLTVTPNAVTLQCEDAASGFQGNKNGQVTVYGTKIYVNADEIQIGSTDTTLTLVGKQVKMMSTGPLILASGDEASINGVALGVQPAAPPQPPPPPPPPEVEAPEPPVFDDPPPEPGFFASLKKSIFG